MIQARYLPRVMEAACQDALGEAKTCPDCKRSEAEDSRCKLRGWTAEHGNLFDARRKISAWRTEYNEQRPHSSLGYKTSNDFAQEHEAKDFYVAGVGQEDSNAVPLPHTPIPARSEGGVNINSRIRECAE
jgi:Integrase core domain